MTDSANIVLAVLNFAAVYLCVRYGLAALIELIKRQRAWYERVLVNQLLIDIDPRVAVGMAIATVVVAALIGLITLGSAIWAMVFAAAALFAPNLAVRYLEQKRMQRLEAQLVDGITMIASGVRAGLNLVQAMQLIVDNGEGPIQQEFAQLLREYQMGLDLNQAMRNASDRIASRNYRLLFTAIEMHRLRGGDAGESMDRIAESIREIQRLEGKLDAITSQGRTQAWMMSLMPFAFLLIYYTIDPESTSRLFIDPSGRIVLLIALVLITTAFFWIRKIMTVDI